MICKQCRDEGKLSKVFPGCGTRTLMNCPTFYDEQGKFHDHDSNTTTMDYSCSNGHRWTERSQPEWTCCTQKEATP